jgi:hypothetical protein
MVLTVPLGFTDYDYLFGMLKLFFLQQRVFTLLTQQQQKNKQTNKSKYKFKKNKNKTKQSKKSKKESKAKQNTMTASPETNLSIIRAF